MGVRRKARWGRMRKSGRGEGWGRRKRDEE